MVGADPKWAEDQRIPEWLRDYYRRGFRLIFFKSKTKNPTEEDWPNRSHSPDDYLKWLKIHKEPPNVGTILGHEVEPGKFLADIDFDWQEGLQILRKILPTTRFGYGRQTRAISHALYLTNEPVFTQYFKDIDDKTLFELRGVKKDGSYGFQSVLPPSIHEKTGEQIEIRTGGEIGSTDNLPRLAVLGAIACILIKHLKTPEHRELHDARLGIAGFLLKEELTEQEVIKIIKVVMTAIGNDDTDVEAGVHSTVAKIRNHEFVKDRGELVKKIGKAGIPVTNRILQWLGRQDFIYDKSGTKIIPDNETNVLTAVEKLEIKLRYNAFLCKPLVHYNGYNGTLEDEINNRIWLDIQRDFFFKPSKQYYDIVVSSAAWKKQFHPVCEYLDSLKWDGVQRLDEWMIRFGGAGDSLYSRAVGAIVLIAAVRRVRKPGCKFDELLVLESEQGMLKSSALKALCPIEDWFSDDLPLNVDAKQIIERTAGKWIIEASELSGMRVSQVEQLKATLSRAVDGPVRMAYGHFPKEKPRQFVIVGTTNSHVYLQDETGNRRFWPVRVQKFDIDGLIKSRDQLWAEAAHREAAGESIRLKEELYKDAGIQQERRRLEDPWEAPLQAKFERDKAHRLTWKQIYGAIGISMDRQDRRSNARLAAILQNLGFRRLAIRDPDTGIVEKGWARDLEFEEESAGAKSDTAQKHDL
jgi:Virulence-associated protein E/Bifunctional DNA primase/polymerase, N-terminal